MTTGAEMPREISSICVICLNWQFPYFWLLTIHLAYIFAGRFLLMFTEEMAAATLRCCSPAPGCCFCSSISGKEGASGSGPVFNVANFQLSGVWKTEVFLDHEESREWVTLIRWIKMWMRHRVCRLRNSLQWGWYSICHICKPYASIFGLVLL